MLDVIMTSTCRKTIEKTIESFFNNVFYSDGYHFIIHIDVLNPKYLNREKEYLKEVERKTGSKVNVTINTSLSKNFHENLTNATNYLFRQIRTKFYLHLQDDWVFLKKVNLEPLIKLMEEHPNIDHIRFSKEKIKEKSWLYHLSGEVSEEYLAPNEEVVIDGIPLVKTPVWSFNPHIGRTSIIKNFIDIPIGVRAETYVCHLYPKATNNNGIYLKGRIGDDPIVKDIGRNKLRQRIRKFKYIITGGKYAEYIYG